MWPVGWRNHSESCLDCIDQSSSYLMGAYTPRYLVGTHLCVNNYIEVFYYILDPAPNLPEHPYFCGEGVLQTVFATGCVNGHFWSGSTQYLLSWLPEFLNQALSTCARCRTWLINVLGVGLTPPKLCGCVLRDINQRHRLTYFLSLSRLLI